MNGRLPEDDSALDNIPSNQNARVELVYDPTPYRWLPGGKVIRGAEALAQYDAAMSDGPDSVLNPASTKAPARLGRKPKKRRPKRPPKVAAAVSAAPAPEAPLERHQRKCVICAHPEREAIDELFVHWHSPKFIVYQYDLPIRSLIRHAHATGVYAKRQGNLRAILDRILEHADNATVSGDSIVRAVRAYTCLTGDNQWVEPPSRVIFSSASASPVIVSPIENQHLVGVRSDPLLPSAEFGDRRADLLSQNLIDTSAIRK